MASITISRGTPFSAASWVMAVTNSLFMLAFPPLFQVWIGAESGPDNKRSGGYPLRNTSGPTAAPSGRARREYITGPGPPDHRYEASLRHRRFADLVGA